MSAPDFAHAWRVVCPNGTTNEVYIDDRDAERQARTEAEWCDRMHTDCVGPHRVESATWSEVTR
jgi:hypothetical protein